MHQTEYDYYVKHPSLTFVKSCFVKGVCMDFGMTLDECRAHIERFYGILPMEGVEELYIKEDEPS